MKIFSIFNFPFPFVCLFAIVLAFGMHLQPEIVSYYIERTKFILPDAGFHINLFTISLFMFRKEVKLLL